jgi:hypothetical protein
MSDYNNYPPRRSFERVLKICPKSATLYIHLWKAQDKHAKVLVAKNEIRKNYSISPTLFRNHLYDLKTLNLLFFVEKDGEFRIDISGCHHND